MANGRQYHMNANSRQHWLDDVIRRVAAEQQRNPEVLSSDYRDPRFANRPMQPAPVPQEPYSGWLGDVVGAVKDYRIPQAPGIPGLPDALNPTSSGINTLKDLLIATGEDFGAQGAHKDTLIPMGRMVGAGLLGGKTAFKAGRSLLPPATRGIMSGAGAAGRGIASGVSAAGRGIESGLGSMKNTVNSLLGRSVTHTPSPPPRGLPPLPDETLAALEPVAQGSRFSELPRLPGEDEAIAKKLGLDEWGSYKKPEPKLGDSDYVLKSGDPGYQPRLDPRGKVSLFESSDGYIRLPLFSGKVDELTPFDIRKLVSLRNQAYRSLDNHAKGFTSVERASGGTSKFEFSLDGKEIDDALSTLHEADTALWEAGYKETPSGITSYSGDIETILYGVEENLDHLVTPPSSAKGVSKTSGGLVTLSVEKARPLVNRRNKLLRELQERFQRSLEWERSYGSSDLPPVEGQKWRRIVRDSSEVQEQIDEIVKLDEELIKSGWFSEADRIIPNKLGEPSHPGVWKELNW